MFPFTPFLSLSLSLLVAGTARATIPTLPGYHVLWSDDFNGANAGTGNVHLSGDGQLYIIPTKDASGNWLSGRIESNAEFTAPTGGAMVIQSELWRPAAGLWPSFFALGNPTRSSGCPWPKCGEWDIFEVTPWLNNHNVASLHYQSADGTDITLTDANNTAAYSGGQYHTWAIKVDLRNADWTEQSISFWLDGTEYYTVTGGQISDEISWSTLAADDYYVILNVAIGGVYPGNPGAQTVAGFASSLRAKYVAVYQTN
ncbi:glycoside hydrolase family 16 protein [Mycena amicta]|nr:glycoside hydrolase family 16 protein [Mycena amicta]